MLRIAVFVFAVAICLFPPATGTAEEHAGGRPPGAHWGKIGWGGFFNNDLFGDGRDRWRTGSYAVSFVFGPPWKGRLPDRFGRVVELRFHTEVIAPATLAEQDVDDRRYAGLFSVGLHTHLELAETEVTAGVDAVFTGPQTALNIAQQATHSAFDSPDVRVLDSQIENGFHPTAVVEAGRSLSWHDTGPRLRPFVQGVAGIETLLRAGVDLTIGGIGQGGILSRDVVTGQRFPVVLDKKGRGVSLVMGMDVAHVADSALFPPGSGVKLSVLRSRMRLGAFHEVRAGWIFFGVTMLSPEFEGQSEAQIVASITGNLRF